MLLRRVGALFFLMEDGGGQQEVQGKGEISVLSAEFCCGPKTALKN